MRRAFTREALDQFNEWIEGGDMPMIKGHSFFTSAENPEFRGSAMARGRSYDGSTWYAMVRDDPVSH